MGARLSVHPALSPTLVRLSYGECLWLRADPRKRLWARHIAGTTPAISHRGDRLAYTRAVEDTNIWRLEMPGPNRMASQPLNLISSTYRDEAPQYSPDGKKIVFTSARSGHMEVWVCESDGSSAVQLTSLGAAGSPRWSPDGQRIIFDSNIEGQFELYSIDASGGRPRRTTHDSADDAVASWSRDGRWIYFVSNRTKEWQVWKMPADGGEAVQVTKHGGYVSFESLDGKFVYFFEGSIRNQPLLSSSGRGRGDEDSGVRHGTGICCGQEGHLFRSSKPRWKFGRSVSKLRDL